MRIVFDSAAGAGVAVMDASAASAAAKRKSFMCDSPFEYSYLKRTAAPPQSALCQIHLALAEAVHGEPPEVAGVNGECWDYAAGDDDHAGLEIALALGDEAGKPGERCEWIFRLALADLISVQRLAPRDPDDLVRLDRLRRADHHAAVPAVLHDHRDRIGLGVNRVAILDQLVGRHRACHKRHDALCRPRGLARRHVLAELKRDLALDPQIDKIRLGDARRRRVNRARKDRPATGMRDTH